MPDLFTIVIYVGLLSLVVLGTFKMVPEGALGVWHRRFPDRVELRYLLILFIIALVSGLRYNVGVDWQTYFDLFDQLRVTPDIAASELKQELGFFALMKLFSGLGWSFQWLLFAMALISWFFVIKSVPKFILPLVLFFLFVDEFFFWSMNGMRQFGAVAIWLYALRFLINRNFKWYVLTLGLGSLLHLSALLLIPLYFVPFHKLYNRWVWIAAFIATFAFINVGTILSYVDLAFSAIGSELGVFSKYLYHYQQGNIAAGEIQTGLGFYFKILTNLTLIVLSKPIVEKNPKLTTYFILFFFGAIGFNMFYDLQILSRFNVYFVFVKSVVLSITVYHYWKEKPLQVPIAVFIMIYFFIFIVAMQNSSNLCCPYQISF